jgi:hypothetical protein
MCAGRTFKDITPTPEEKKQWHTIPHARQRKTKHTKRQAATLEGKQKRKTKEQS